eukprot:jgi/Tetstr1/437330/TSEL_002814.t1
MPRTRQSIYSTLLGVVSVGKKKCGLRAWNDAGPRIVSCKLTGCGQQALKLFHSAKAEVQHSFLRDCDAEGVVAMGKSSVMLEAAVERTHIAGGRSIALLADDDAVVACDQCVVDGNIHATDLAWDAIDLARNKLTNSDLKADMPPLAEPFVYVPNPYA